MLFTTLALAMTTLGQGPTDWYEPFPAHKVAGNVYYVGSRDLATYLITTPEGHLLINSGFERTVSLIQKSVESLGFKMTDVKILLASHAHSDHVAGHALLQKITGARVFVMRGDDQVIASGGKGQYLYTTSRWDPCKVDRVLEDRDEVRLGGVTLVARRTPGHTRGCTTWTWRVQDGSQNYDVVVIGSPNVNPGFQLVNNKDYPEIADDFARTFEVLKSMPCDVFLGAHGGYYGMLERYELLKKGQADAFVNPQGYKEYVAQKERAFRKTLAEQRARAEQAQPASTGAESKALEGTLAWLKAMPTMSRSAIGPAMERDCFQKLTVADLKTIKELHIGGHLIKEGKFQPGHVEFPADDYRHLTALPALEKLGFMENGLGDAALVHVGKLGKLTHLTFGDHQVTDAGLKQLANLKHLTYLNLCFPDKKSGGMISDKGMEAIARIDSLETLDLRATQITDAGLASLQKLPRLKELLVNGTAISDQGLVHLHAIKSLRVVNVFNCKGVTPQGIAALKKALPDCEVRTVQAK